MAEWRYWRVSFWELYHYSYLWKSVDRKNGDVSRFKSAFLSISDADMSVCAAAQCSRIPPMRREFGGFRPCSASEYFAGHGSLYCLFFRRRSRCSPVLGIRLRRRFCIIGSEPVALGSYSRYTAEYFVFERRRPAFAHPSGGTFGSTRSLRTVYCGYRALVSGLLTLYSTRNRRFLPRVPRYR